MANLPLSAASGALLLASTLAAHATCGNDPDACEIPLGTYHIAVPESTDGPIPAVIFLHGAGGTGMGALNNTGMSGTLLERGYAVIGPNGLDRPGRFGTGWSFLPDRPQQRDELAFVMQIRDDAVERFDIDPEAIVLAGFSIGGSLTSYLACAAPETFAAYAPVGGAFWRPLPETCDGPVRLLHTHGWRDRTVPLEGRPLGGGRIYQGDVWQAMEIWRDTNACDELRADTFDTEGLFWRRVWDECADDTALEFALHPGGHGIPRGWSDMIIDWFENLP